MLSKTALCIGHPAHEIKIIEWARLHRPLVDVLTDGSGSEKSARYLKTKKLLEQGGARMGVYHGNWTDRNFYELVLRKMPAPFIEVAQSLAEEWISQEIETVAGDMLEGFSSTHDLCRIIINAAVGRVEKSTGRKLLNLQFPLEAVASPETPGAVLVHLSDEQFASKKRLVEENYPSIAEDINKFIARHGITPYQVEVLLPATGFEGLTWEKANPPYYETYGRQQIALGHYSDLITHAEHIRPLAEALYRWAETN